MAKPIFIMQTGCFPDEMRPRFGDFSQCLRRTMGVGDNDIHVVNVHENEALPHHSSFCATVITGSPAMVTDHAEWSERAAVWIRAAMANAHPMFGTCFGHQLMAYALGGTVDYLPHGREIGTCQIEIATRDATGDPLVRYLPPDFPAQLAHLQTIVKKPRGAITLASSAHDPNQIVRYGSNAISTQFHPEFTADVMSAFVQCQRRRLENEGYDVPALLKAVQASPQAGSLLQQFIARHRN